MTDNINIHLHDDVTVSYDLIIEDSSSNYIKKENHFNTLYNEWGKLCKDLKERRLKNLNVNIRSVSKYNEILHNIINISEILNYNNLNIYIF